MQYIDLKPGAVRRFSDSEQLPEDGQVRPKQVAINCDFNVIVN
jgi:hypothetical protein